MNEQIKELKSQLNGITNDITDIRTMIEKRKESGTDYTNLSNLLEDLNKQKTKIERELGKLDKSFKSGSKPQKLNLYDFKADVLQEAKEHFSTSSIQPSIHEVRKYLVSLSKSVGCGFTREDEKEVVSGAAELYLNNKDFKLDIDKSVSPSEWIRELRDRAFFIAKNDIHKFIEWALTAVADIQNTCETGEVSKEFTRDALNIIIESSMMGTGKTTFQMSLVEGAKSLGIAAEGDVEVPGGETLNHPDESNNLLVCHSDRTNQKVDITTLKQIGRREKYTYRELYHQPVQVKGRAIMLGSTNNHSYINDDTFRTVHVIPIPFAKFPEMVKERASSHGSTYESFYRLGNARSIRSKFLSYLADLAELVGNNLPNEDGNCQIESFVANSLPLSSAKLLRISEIPFADLAIKALEQAHNTYIWNSQSLSVSSLRNNAPDVIDTDAKERGVCRFFQTVWASKEYGLKARQNQREEWWQFYIKGSDLENITTECLMSTKEMTSYDVVNEAMDEWDKLIEFFDRIGDDTPPAPTKPEHDDIESDLVTPIKAPVVEPKHSYAPQSSDNPFPAFPTDGSDDEYETVNPIKEGHARCDENVEEMTTYLFEADDMPLEEQYETAERLFKAGYIWRAVDSAGKSVHCLLHANIDAESREEYGYIHSRLNDILFGGRADRSTNNPSRGTRRPNGRRLGRGFALQNLIFKDTTNTVDISKLHREWLNHEKPRREMLRNMAQAIPIRAKDCSIREWVEGWKEGEFKNAALDICDGTGDHSDWMGLAPFLVRHGFGYDQIMSEIPGLDGKGWNFTKKQFDRYANATDY